PPECLGDALHGPLRETLALEAAAGQIVPELAGGEHRDDLTGRVVADALAVEPSGADISGVVELQCQAVQLDEVVEVYPPHPCLLPETTAGLDQPGLQPRLPQSERHPCAVVTLHRPRQLVRPNHDLPLRHRRRLPFSSLHLHYTIMTPWRQ